MAIDFDTPIIYHPVVNGDEIKRIREDRGWTRGDFARVLGSSHQAVYNWETNKVRPSPIYARLIRQIEQAFPTKQPSE